MCGVLFSHLVEALFAANLKDGTTCARVKLDLLCAARRAYLVLQLQKRERFRRQHYEHCIVCEPLCVADRRDCPFKNGVLVKVFRSESRQATPIDTLFLFDVSFASG